MILTKEIKHYLQQSVLCWLATSYENIPNVSPKEVFCYYNNDSILIANIASPTSVRNISKNENVCLCCINILVQKGIQLKGTAKVVGPSNSQFNDYLQHLQPIAGERFTIKSVILMKITSSKPVLAPSYQFYPETTEDEQVQKAKARYGF